MFAFYSHRMTFVFLILSLHDALPIYFAKASSGLAEARMREGGSLTPGRVCRMLWRHEPGSDDPLGQSTAAALRGFRRRRDRARSEEHTSELQSPCNLVCRLLLEKKKQ